MPVSSCAMSCTAGQTPGKLFTQRSNALPELRQVGLLLPFNPLFAVIVLEFPAHRMNVLGRVTTHLLRSILKEKTRTLNAIIRRTAGFDGSSPAEVRFCNL